MLLAFFAIAVVWVALGLGWALAFYLFGFRFETPRRDLLETPPLSVQDRAARVEARQEARAQRQAALN